jgi:chemotaxis protein MotB
MSQPDENKEDAEKTETGMPVLEKYLKPVTLQEDYSFSKSRKNDDWLITYTDMVTLLITLFIVMIAHATFEKEEEGLLPLIFQNYITGKEVSDLLKNKENYSRGDVIYLGPVPEEKETKEDIPVDASKKQRAEKLRRSVNQAGLSDSVNIEIISGDIEVRINEKVLYPLGEAKISLKGQQLLSDLIPVFSGGEFDIIVEGHTDDLPIATAQYSSNWELSAFRALSVVHYLVKQGISPARLRAVAYGETRPLVPNSGSENRRKNRRVQIILK